MSEWTGYVMQAKSWYEKGQLGVDFIHVPEWIPRAFAILDNELYRAMEFKRENK